jgi:hypothetical protein
MRIPTARDVLFTLSLEVFLSTLLLAQSITLVDNGPSDQRIDIVFVPEGFADLGPFITACDEAIATFRTFPPFQEYFSYFNIHRVAVSAMEAPDVDQVVFITTLGPGQAAYGGPVWVGAYQPGGTLVHELGHSNR